MAQTLPQSQERVCILRAQRRTEEKIMARLRRSEIELLWGQFEDLIEHGKNKDSKTKLVLMKRLYQLLAKTMVKKKTKSPSSK